jgi:transcriptional regulator with XRE-family HTH domain
MAHSVALVEVLKKELKARGVTYAALADALRLSEATVKRMFSHRDFTLKRLDEICACAKIDFSELTRGLARDETLLSRLTAEQEKEIVADRKLFLVAVCALNHVTYEQILERYDLTPAECVRLLTRLDRLKFIELQPGNRIRLIVSHTFAWLPDGPIQRFFNDLAHTEFFRSRFSRPDEFLLVLNGMLSKGSRAAMIEKLKRVAREFSAYHNDDVRLALGERSPMSICLAFRHWELEAFAELRRRPKAAAPARTELSSRRDTA